MVDQFEREVEFTGPASFTKMRIEMGAKKIKADAAALSNALRTNSVIWSQGMNVRFDTSIADLDRVDVCISLGEPIPPRLLTNYTGHLYVVQMAALASGKHTCNASAVIKTATDRLTTLQRALRKDLRADQLENVPSFEGLPEDG